MRIANPKAAGENSAQAMPVPVVVTDESGSIQGGFKSIGVINRSDTETGEFNGISVAPGESQSYPYVGQLYAADMEFDATGTTFAIIIIY